MKLVTHYMEQINNVEIFPIISMLIFITIFGLVVYRALTADKSFIDKASQLPLEDE